MKSQVLALILALGFIPELASAQGGVGYSPTLDPGDIAVITQNLDFSGVLGKNILPKGTKVTIEKISYGYKYPDGSDFMKKTPVAYLVSEPCGMNPNNKVLVDLQDVRSPSGLSEIMSGQTTCKARHYNATEIKLWTGPVTEELRVSSTNDRPISSSSQRYIDADFSLPQVDGSILYPGLGGGRTVPGI